MASGPTQAESRRLVAAAVLISGLLAGCGPVRRGPVAIDVPNGWQLTRSDASSLQFADGTAGSGVETKAGTATAVFDVYLETTHTPQSYETLLRGRAQYTVQRRRYGGRPALVFRYTGAEFGGSQEAVLFPEYRVLAVYRAAYPNDDGAFRRGLPAFHRALASIRFLRPVPSATHGT